VDGRALGAKQPVVELLLLQGLELGFEVLLVVASEDEKPSAQIWGPHSMGGSA
jgi:hypothetical protein